MSSSYADGCMLRQGHSRPLSRKIDRDRTRAAPVKSFHSDVESATASGVPKVSIARLPEVTPGVTRVRVYSSN